MKGSFQVKVQIKVDVAKVLLSIAAIIALLI